MTSSDEQQADKPEVIDLNEVNGSKSIWEFRDRDAWRSDTLIFRMALAAVILTTFLAATVVIFKAAIGQDVPTILASWVTLGIGGMIGLFSRKH